MPSTAVITRFIRFTLTGLLLTGVHTAIATAYIEWISDSPPLANGLAFTLATILSYFVNTQWSFAAQLSAATFRKFIIVSGVGLLLSMTIAALAQSVGLHYLIGILAVALLVPPITFCLHQLWTYRP